jgi:hypothetical protein
MTSGSARVLLVVGSARSGTTFTASRVVAHTGAVGLPETHYWRSIIGRRPDLLVGRPSTSRWSRALTAAERRGPFLDGGFSPAELAHRLPAGGSSAVEVWRLLLSVGNLVVENTPRHLSWLPSLLDLPGHRALVVVRDPRAVVASLQQVDFSRSSDAAVLAARWNRDVALAERVQRRHGPELVQIVRYEDVVTGGEPANALGSLGIPAGGGGDPSGLLGRNEPWKQGAAGPADPARVDAWRDELEPDAVGLVEALCAASMARHGYPPSGTPRRPGLVERARSLQDLQVHLHHRMLAEFARRTRGWR